MRLPTHTLSICLFFAVPFVSTNVDAKERVLLNKPKIAEDTLKERKGLRELDNPHIAPGLLLRKLQVDPERQYVDTERLREQRIQSIETRGQLADDTAPAETIPRPPEIPLRSAEPKQDIAARKPFERAPARGFKNWLVVGAAAVLVITGLLARAVR